MRARLAVALLLVLLLTPLASGASWLRPGYDPGRTGAVPFEGPATNDTAFVVQLPGVPMANTVLVGDHALVATVDADGIEFDGDTVGLDETGLWRVDLTTATVERVLDLPDTVGVGLVTPHHLFVEEDDDLVAIEIASGQAVWRVQAAADNPLVVDRDYLGTPVLFEQTLYTGFRISTGVSGSTPVADPFYTTPPNLGVLAVDLATGEVLWERERTDAPQRLDADYRDTIGTGVALAADPDRVYAYFKVGVEDGPYVEPERLQYELWAFDRDDGEVRWNRSDRPHQAARADTPVASATILEGIGDTCCGWPVVTGTVVHIRLDAFEALNPATGERVWPTPSPAGRTDQILIQGTTTMGARGDVFIGTSPQTVYRLNAVTGDLVWLKNLPPSAQTRIFGIDPVVLDGETAFLPTMEDTCGLGGPGLEARDVETGTLRWQWRYLPDVGREGCSITIPHRPAFGPGVAVVGANDGTVHVIGQTPASLGTPALETSTTYPEPGQTVRLSAAGTPSGAFGEATRYMVDWGDGTVSGWQRDPVFEHSYNETGEHRARLIAGNDANQTSSTFVTMHVGGSEPNLLSTAFAPEHQEMTFGVLGIAMALGGGAIGVARRYRKRSRLQDELEALETGFAETRANPSECEAFLETRKARARSLLLDGVLTEEQFGVIESRVTELTRQLRTGVLDERLQFLPYGMVQSLKRMLADGEISVWERETMEGLLAEDETLNEAQRERVRGLLERWSEEGST